MGETRTTASKTAAKNAAKEPAKEAVCPESMENTGTEVSVEATGTEAEQVHMVAVVVTSKFKDRCTGKLNTVGDVIEVTQERLDEILAAGDYVKKQ